MNKKLREEMKVKRRIKKRGGKDLGGRFWLDHPTAISGILTCFIAAILSSYMTSEINSLRELIQILCESLDKCHATCEAKADSG